MDITPSIWSSQEPALILVEVYAQQDRKVLPPPPAIDLLQEMIPPTFGDGMR